MPKLLTAETIKQVKPIKLRNGKLQRREIADAGCKTLYLHIQPSGAKSWVMMVMRPNGKLGKLHLGPVDLSGREPPIDEKTGKPRTPEIGMSLTLADAHWLTEKLRMRHKAGRKAGKDIIADDRDRKADAKTKIEQPDTKFAAVAQQFIDEYARPHTRRWLETAHCLGLDYKDDANPGASVLRFKDGLADRWQDKEITAITSDEVYRVIDETKRRGIPGLPCRTKGISDSRGRAMARTLSKLFGWALQHRKIKANPSAGVFVPPAPAARKRPLSKEEVIAFWRATDQISAPFGAMLKLLLLTGSRLREVAGMRRSELNQAVVEMSEGQHRTVEMMWTIPGSRTKNKLEHVVPLPPLARDIVASVKQLAGKPGFVFSTTGRSPVSGFSKTKKRLDELMRAAAKTDGVEFLPWRLHDLRKTFSTMLHESPPKGLSIAPHVVEALVNHISGHKAGVAGVYNAASYLPEKVIALERWANHISGMVEGRTATVTPLRA
jgi:integrase